MKEEGPKEECASPSSPLPSPPKCTQQKAATAVLPKVEWNWEKGDREATKLLGWAEGGRHSGSISVPLAGDLGGVGGRNGWRRPD